MKSQRALRASSPSEPLNQPSPNEAPRPATQRAIAERAKNAGTDVRRVDYLESCCKSRRAVLDIDDVIDQ